MSIYCEISRNPLLIDTLSDQYVEWLVSVGECYLDHEHDHEDGAQQVEVVLPREVVGQHLHSTVQYSAVQRSTAQYSAVQRSTAQYSAVQPSTAQ